MMMNKSKLQQICTSEKRRNLLTINLIASENYMSKYVSSFLNNIYLSSKYGEGYPNSRYYNGCKYIDELENHAIEQAKKVFGCNFANVQPHSGTQANMAVLLQMLNPQSTILSLGLNDGGHLSHGHKVSFAGKLFKIENYFLDNNYQLDYEKIRSIAISEKPSIIICGYSSFSGNIDFSKFSLIAKEVGALLLADISHVAGIVAAKRFNNPFPYADIVTSTTHKTLRGPRGAIILCNDEKIARQLDRSVFPLTQGGPAFNVIAAKAAALEEAQEEDFKLYINNVLLNSVAMHKVFKDEQWYTYCDHPENHMFLLKTINETYKSFPLTGFIAANILEKCGIIVNKNGVPNDTSKLTECSGIRIGVAAMTTRGMVVSQAQKIALLISNILRNNISVRDAKHEVSSILGELRHV